MMRTKVRQRRNNKVRLFMKRMRQSRWYRTLVLRTAMATLFMLIGVPGILALIFSQKAEAHDCAEEVYYKYYHRIEVVEGDSLWSIAKENYVGSEQTIQEYIAEVQHINHCWDGKIYAGEELMIPYYSTEFK